jgi:hypothetical protein
VQRAPGIPCALCLEGKESRWQALGKSSREIVKSCLPIEIGRAMETTVIASVAKQSIVRRKKVWIASSLRSSQ